MFLSVVQEERWPFCKIIPKVASFFAGSKPQLILLGRLSIALAEQPDKVAQVPQPHVEGRLAHRHALLQACLLYTSIGLFIIVQMVRNVQMLIPAYDFCVPEKECVASSDNPCELFRRIDFPTSEFFPPKSTDLGGPCK